MSATRILAPTVENMLPIAGQPTGKDHF
jgi:hypothetical protein